MTSRLELVTECEHGEESAHYICEGLSYTNAAAYMEMEHTDKKCLCPGGGSRVQVTITDEIVEAAAEVAYYDGVPSGEWGGGTLWVDLAGWEKKPWLKKAREVLLAAFREIGADT